VSRVLVRRTTLRPADAFGEAFTSIVARPLTATATGFGTLLAVAWFVAVLGLVSTASGQVASDFARRLGTTILVTGPAPTVVDPPFPFPADVERRVDALSGVVASGVYWQVRPTGPAVIAATPGYLAAAGVAVSQGRLFDAWDSSHGVQVCLVGSALARSLGISGLRSPHTIHINGAGCVISGIISRAARGPS
jgi:putative ABC transport system permease protein